MKLQVGERLPGSGPPTQPGGYVVTEVIGETPWSGLYAARKIFYNFDFTAKRPRETDEKEWLDVLLRTVNYPKLDSAEYVAGRRALARAELRIVLGNRSSNLWPEPVDLLEAANTRDPFTYARDGATKSLSRTVLAATGPQAPEPVVVFARPRGDTLARWLQTGPAIAARLAVVAELLEFVQAAHIDGLLLNGLGPSALLVDRAGRMHFLGTDMVVPLRDLGRGATGEVIPDWRPFFPPERYPRGYSAPECFDSAAARDQRTDLYAWAAVAYFVLTGDRPVQLALDQGQPWARFGDAQFTRLEESLRPLAAAQVRDWAEQLGVDVDTFRRDWPHGFVHGVGQCLHPEPRQRPPSVAELRAWLTAPPPPPPRAALALRLPRSDTLRLSCALAAADNDVEVVVCRGVHVQPLTADQGERVAAGPPFASREDVFPRQSAQGGNPDDFMNPSGDAVRYSFFTRRRGGACSVATPAHLLDPYPANLRRLAESVAQPGAADEPEPPVVGLLFGALDPARTAEALLASALPSVRGWGLHRVAAARRQPGASASLETLLLRALQDPVQALRLEAVRALLEGPAPTEARVRRVFETLAAGHPEDCIPAARALILHGVSEELLRPVLAALKQEIPANCPACGVEVVDRDVTRHLINVHGYLEVAGALLPRAEALAGLWERVFTAADQGAHERLCELLPVGEGTGAPSAYVAALEAELRRRGQDLLNDRARKLPRLVGCLRSNRAARAAFPTLLRSPEGHVREVGRELLLADLGDRLSGEKVSSTELRRQVDEICPADLIDEKLFLCQHLAILGVALDAVDVCVRQLQAERPVICTECGAQVAQADHDAHLRRDHHIYEFRGVRRSLPETLALLLDAVCGGSPDYEAWAILEGVAREEYEGRADSELAAQLGGKLLVVDATRREQCIGAAAEAVAASESGPRLLPALAAPWLAPTVQSVAWQLALEVAARLPPPVPSALIDAALPLLSDKRLSSEIRVAAVAALLKSTGRSGAAALKVLRAFVAGVAKKKAIDQLHDLEQHAGQGEAIDALCAELEDQLRMACPRCQVELPRREMIDHLWEQHRLILDGRRVREPWQVIEGWLGDYRLERDPAVLARCQELAARADPEDGPARLQRLLLQKGVADDGTRRELLKQAARQGASLCPGCSALVTPVASRQPLTASWRRQGWAAPGYRVEVSDRGLVPRLEIETPEMMLYRGGEPGRRLTRKGALLVLTLPLLVAAGVLAVLQPPLEVLQSWNLPRWALGAAVGGLALLVALLVPLLKRRPPPPQARALNHGWTRLVRHLCVEGFPGEGLPLTAGLAEISPGRGNIEGRREVVEEARIIADRVARAQPGLALCAGVVTRLALEESEEKEPLKALAGQVGRCFEGKMPLGFAAGLLRRSGGLRSTAAERRRLRVLLCARAFDAGLEVRDLIVLGRACAELGAVLDVDHGDALVQLRLLWSLRPGRDWEAAGSATTVFDLAQREDSESLLSKHADLLLAARGTPPLYVCGDGVWFQSECFTEEPQRITSVARSLHAGGGYDLIVGGRRLWFAEDPAPLAERLESWLGWYFRAFLPQLGAYRGRRSGAAMAKLLERSGVECPECQRRLLPRIGDVAFAAEGAEPTAKART